MAVAVTVAASQLASLPELLLHYWQCSYAYPAVA
jgi:hypothetical protein